MLQPLRYHDCLAILSTIAGTSSRGHSRVKAAVLRTPGGLLAEVLEAQETMVATDAPDAIEYNAAAAAGVVQGRRRVQELIRAELK